MPAKKLISVDTNILVRLLVNDDQAQAKRVRTLFEHNRILVTTGVILETEWVLRAAYGFHPDQILASLEKLFGLRQLKLDNPLLVFRVRHLLPVSACLRANVGRQRNTSNFMILV